jgi:hypothetical protein
VDEFCEQYFEAVHARTAGMELVDDGRQEWVSAVTTLLAFQGEQCFRVGEGSLLRR